MVRMLSMIVLSTLLLRMDVTAKKIPECDTWLCLIPDVCKFQSNNKLIKISESDEIKDECHAIWKIKPYSISHWRVIIESWSPGVTSIIIKEKTQLKIECTKSGDTSTANSPDYAEFKDVGKSSALPLSCEMIFGQMNGDRIQLFDPLLSSELSTNDISIAKSTLDNADLYKWLPEKTRCDQTSILYKDVVESGKDFQQVDATTNVDKVTCPKDYDLEYLNGDTYVLANQITCQKFEDGLYNYVTELESGEIIDERNEFSARCVSQYCNRCPPPHAFPGTIGPTLVKAKGECEVLTCPEGFRITKKSSGVSMKTAESAICSKVDDHYYWKIGEEILDDTVQVDCFNAKCKPITLDWCTQGCFMDPIDVKPRCDAHYFLVGHFDWPREVEVVCDLKRAVWQYLKDGSMVDLPNTVYLTCQSDMIPLTGPGIPPTIQLLFVVLGMTMVFFAASAFIVFK